MNEPLSDDLVLQPPAQPRPLPPGAEFKIGDIVGNSYQIVDYIGRGAMGYVYHAHHVRLPKEYALKTLSTDQITEVAWVRFQIEAQAIAKMFHPNIVGLHNFGLHRTPDGFDHPFYVMDFLRGCNLMERLRDYDPPPVNTVLYIFLQAASGFGYAHSKGVIHRDVKPANIVLLDQPDATGSTIKIVDFGIVKLTFDAEIDGDHLGHDEENLGSPYYMSPEQCLGRTVDARSDIYSLGVTFFETLTGEPPFVARSAVEIKHMHQSAPTPILNEVVEGGNFPDAVQAVLERMMAKDPDMRYQAMENLCSDLIAILQGDEPFYCYNAPIVDGSGNIYLQHTRSTVVAPALNPNLIPPSRTVNTAAQTPDFQPLQNDSLITPSLAEEGKALVRSALTRNGVSLSEEAASIEADQRARNSTDSQASREQVLKVKKLLLGLGAGAIVLATVACGFLVWQNFQSANSKPKPPPRRVLAVAKPKVEKVKFDGDEDIEPTTSLADTNPYLDSKSGGGKARIFNFPTDCLIGSIYSYDWKTKKERIVKARGTVEFAESEWLMYLPSRLVAVHPGYVLRFGKGDVTAVRLVDGSDSDAVLEACTAIPAIDELQIYDTHGLTAKCIPSLSKFTQISKFDGNNCTLDGAMLARANCWNHIRDFQLAAGGNCTAILAKLKMVKRLEYVNLQRCQLQPQDFKALSELSTLQYLNLSYTKVTLSQLKLLSKLNRLHTLSVVDCGLDRRAVPVLKQFKGLKVLQVQPSNKAMFAAALPKVTVK
ncbi:MAG: serine/threonine-protein kinase [Candidatus Obscuribacterales bacterium]